MPVKTPRKKNAERPKEEAKMESEVPYGIKNRNHWWHVDGLGEEQRLNQWAYKIGAEWWASKLNAAHAAGRKAERERCLRILRSHQGKCEEILLTDYLETPF